MSRDTKASNCMRCLSFSGETSSIDLITHVAISEITYPLKLLYPAETSTSLSCANLSPASRLLLLGRIPTHQAKTHHVRIWSNYRRLLLEVLIRAKPTNYGTTCWDTSGGSFEAILRRSVPHNVARLGASGKSGKRCIQIARKMRETIKDCGSYKLFLESWLQACLTQLV